MARHYWMTSKKCMRNSDKKISDGGNNVNSASAVDKWQRNKLLYFKMKHYFNGMWMKVSVRNMFTWLKLIFFSFKRCISAKYWPIFNFQKVLTSPFYFLKRKSIFKRLCYLNACRIAKTRTVPYRVTVIFHSAL